MRRVEREGCMWVILVILVALAVFIGVVMLMKWLIVQLSWVIIGFTGL